MYNNRFEKLKGNKENTIFQEEKDEPEFNLSTTNNMKRVSKLPISVLDKIDYKRQNINDKLKNKSSRLLPFSIFPTPEPWKYHPSFKAVHKKVPSVIITKPIKKDKLPDLDKKTVEQPSKNNTDRIALIKNISNETRNNVHSINISTIDTFRSKKNDTKSLDFGLYSARKDFLINKTSSKVLTYINPDMKIQKNHLQGVNFSKMITRNNVDNLNVNFAPAVCTYYPNFDAISRSTKPCSKNVETHKKNYFLVQKMWRSYNVSLDYNSVKFKPSSNHNLYHIC